MQRKKLLVIGHGRHGKDTVCEILRDKYGYSFESSSQFCSKLFIYEMLKKKYNPKPTKSRESIRKIYRFLTVMILKISADLEKSSICCRLPVGAIFVEFETLPARITVLTTSKAQKILGAHAPYSGS